MLKKLTIFVSAAILAGCAENSGRSPFARVEDGRFVTASGDPYYFVGTNFWYGAMLGSEGEGGDRERLLKELDLMKSAGITNLRILVGSDGDTGIHSKVEPVLQTAPGEYNDEILDGLDFLLCEMGKREMYAVLYLNNAWEWSGGYCQYLQWSGKGKYPIPGVDGWNAYMEYVKQFHEAEADDPVKLMFEDHVRNIISRTNRYTGNPYSEDPYIFSWQIANEPRAFSDGNKERFAAWIERTAKLIKSLDPNHMVSTGSEGEMGSEGDIDLWLRIHAFDEIDYANIHAWPYNWRWISEENMFENLGEAKRRTAEYIDRHVAKIAPYGKPVVLEEFGFPRDGFQFTPGSPVTLRDSYYDSVFEKLFRSAEEGGLFAGCNFWGWGGYAVPSGIDTFWKKGDDYCGDPAQEEQGLNSVFAGDLTVGVIANANKALAQVTSKNASTTPGNKTTEAITALLCRTAAENKYLFGHQDFPFYGFRWRYEPGRSDVKDVCGDYPAVLGCDLGELETGADQNLDGVPFEVMKQAIRDHHARGGITTISWHPRNPLTGGDAWDVSDHGVVRSVLPGGSRHALFNGWLDMVAGFINSLEDHNGRPIPIIFRPWHEHTGSWFWWGQELCTVEQYTALWRMTAARLRERGADFLLAYSPNLTDRGEVYMERYPGDLWVDILGADTYHHGGLSTADRFMQRTAAGLAMMDSITAARGKLTALTETGAEGIPVAEWWTGVLHPALRGSNLTYVLLWRNAFHESKPDHFYAPFPGQGSADDFKAFYELPETVFAEDIRNYRKSKRYE